MYMYYVHTIEINCPLFATLFACFRGNQATIQLSRLMAPMLQFYWSHYRTIWMDELSPICNLATMSQLFHGVAPPMFSETLGLEPLDLVLIQKSISLV